VVKATILRDVVCVAGAGALAGATMRAMHALEFSRRERYYRPRIGL
jgi:hypothetical protein